MLVTKSAQYFHHSAALKGEHRSSKILQLLLMENAIGSSCAVSLSQPTQLGFLENNLHLGVFMSSLNSQYVGLAGLPRGTHTRLKLSSEGLNPNPAINRHPGISQAGWLLNVCAIPPMDDKLGVPSTDINWCTLRIPGRPPRRVGELSPASLTNSKFLPWPTEGTASAARLHP